MQFFKEKVSKSEAYIWDFHQKMASCFQNLWCQDAILYSSPPPFSVVFFARKTKYFNEIRRNNSKQSQYNVKFTENEKNMKKNLFKIIDFL